MMNLKLALRNLLRHRTRTIISLLTIIGTICTVVIIKGYFHNILSSVRTYGAENELGHLQIASKKKWDGSSEKLKDQLYSMNPQIIKEIVKVPDVISVSPRISGQGLLSYEDNQFGVRIVGIDPKGEETLKKTLLIPEGKIFENADENTIMIGLGLEKKLKTKIGDSVTIITQTIDGVVNALDLTLVGVFQTGASEVDDHAAILPYKTLQNLLDTDKQEVWIVRLKNYLLTDTAKLKIEEIIMRLDPGLKIKTWRELAELYVKTEEFFYVQESVVNLILMILTVLAVFNTVGMTVYERTGEIGALRALGQTRMEILKIFMTEGILLAFFAGVLGSALSFILIYIINAAKFITAIPGATEDVEIVIDVVGRAFLNAILLGFFSTLMGTFIPSLRASKIHVVDALRKNI